MDRRGLTRQATVYIEQDVGLGALPARELVGLLASVGVRVGGEITATGKFTVVIVGRLLRYLCEIRR